MSSSGWVIPVASLSAICVMGLIFFFWWFPRTWKKGTEAELRILAQRAQQKRAEADLEGGELGDTDDPDAPRQPPKAFVYSPPAITPYG